MMKTSSFASMAFAAFVAVVPARRAAAHEPWAFGFGSRAAAMGGAVAADTTDFSANYYNPAGLAGETGLRLSLGYTYAWQNLKINGRDSGLDSVHGLVFGFASTGKICSVPVAL